MRIPVFLVVNDDGVDTEGIRLLAAAAAQLGEVYVAAPSRQSSAMSQRITIYEPLTVRRVPFPPSAVCAWSVDGTPADCVKAALHELMPVWPDFLLSGVNFGYNTGFDIAYSGTVGAAMEGLMNGVPSMAFSSSHEGDLALAECALPSLLERLLNREVERKAIWNVNFPGVRPEECRGILWNRRIAPMQLYLDAFSVEEREDGSLSMKNQGLPIDLKRVPENSDVHAVLSGYISVSKIYCPVLQG